MIGCFFFVRNEHVFHDFEIFPTNSVMRIYSLHLKIFHMPEERKL